MTRPSKLRKADMPAAHRQTAHDADDRPRVLVVDDDEPILRVLQMTLTAAGYQVTTARSATEAFSWYSEREFDLILLDLILPDMDGLGVLETIRKKNKTPIIVISGKTSVTDKIDALDTGANDYLAKPFDIGELLARIRVTLREIQARTPQDRLIVDVKSRRATIDGRAVRLSPKELALVSLLLAAKGEPVSHEEIQRAIWPAETEEYMTKVRVLVWQIRHKIEPQADAPEFLLSVPPGSYRLCAK